LRIIAGKYKGRQISAPAGENTRPAPDILREALFSIIGSDIINSSFADLYAGSGAVGLESISRGSSSVVLIDNWIESIKCIKQNVAKIGCKENTLILKSDLSKYEVSWVEAVKRCEFIFLGPPYNKGLGAKTLDILTGWHILANNQSIIIQREYQEEIPFESMGLSIIDERKYGKNVIDFLRFAEGETREKSDFKLEVRIW